MNPIVYAIPVFFLLMAVEMWVAHLRGRRAYRMGDTIGSVGLGVYSQLTGLYARLLSFGLYVLVYESLRWFDLPRDALWVWCGALLLYDFLYYWHHRAGHEIALFWAAHVVHHQSEDYNLGTALRQTSSGFLVGWVFYLPMALLGVPPLVFAVVALIDLLYQYWIHTEQVGRLGWFDRVFASPSNHRVHHAVNDRYLDKNYGGILILWDRCFGTFAEERDDDPPVYGTRKPLRSFDPVWANLETYVDLVAASWRARGGLWVRLQPWFRPPGWRADGVQPAFRLPPPEARFDPPLARAATIYAGLCFAVVVVIATSILARFTGTAADHAQVLWVLALLWALSRWCQAPARLGVVLAVVWLAPLLAWLWQPDWLPVPGNAVQLTGVLLGACVLGAIGAVGVGKWPAAAASSQAGVALMPAAERRAPAGDREPV